MLLHRYNHKGFTLVELMVIIFVIGVIAAITSFSAHNFLANSRDSHRASDALVVSEALEKYYDLNGEYPSCESMTQTPKTIKTSVLKDIDETALLAPTNNNTEMSSIRCEQISESSTDDFYAYQGDGSAPCENTAGTSCLEFNLSYKQEDGTIKVIESRRKAQLSTSGSLTLNGVANGFTEINLSWNTLQNTLGYVVQQSSVSDFTTDVTTHEGLTTTNLSVTELDHSTTYYFRAMAVAMSSQTDWSTPIAVTTQSLPSPTLSVSTVSPTVIDTSWTASSNATAYRLEWSLNNSFTPLVSSATLPSSTTTRSLTGLDQGQRYYIRVFATANNGSVVSDASNTINQATSITTPSVPVVTYATSGDTTTWSWPAVSCPTGTIAQYATRLYQDDPTGWRAWTSFGTTISRAVTTNYQGYEYKVSAKARCTRTATSISSAETSESTNAGAAGYIRPVDAPIGTASNFQKSSRVSGSTTFTAISFTNPTCGLGTTPRWSGAQAARNGGSGSYNSIFNTVTDLPTQQTRWFGATITNSLINWSGGSSSISFYSPTFGNPYYNNVGPRTDVTSASAGVGAGNTYVAPVIGIAGTAVASGAQSRTLVFHACMNDDTKRKSTWAQSSVVVSPILTW